MFRSASLFIGTSFTVAVFTIFVTSNVDSIVGIPHKIYSMQRILIHIKSRSLCYMCPSAPRVCSEPGGQKPVLSLSLDLIDNKSPLVLEVAWCWVDNKPFPESMMTQFIEANILHHASMYLQNKIKKCNIFFYFNNNFVKLCTILMYGLFQ